MKLLCFLFAIAILVTPSCKENQNKDEDGVITNCYSKVDRDTIALMTKTLGDSVLTGLLRYKWFEKDENVGTIRGVFRGDTLFAEYNFRSEGLESTREVVFLKKGNLLIEGIGKVEVSGSHQYFVNPKEIKFNSGIELAEGDCDH